ncbi:MAG: hypothetical protein SF029_07355 [bacterium]|nr:hypothetical protein [bacterium]
MPVVINDEVRRIYTAVKDELLKNGYSEKVSMLQSKKRIIEYEIAQRSNRSFQSESFLGRVWEAFGNSVSDNMELTALENQLNALIVEDLALL